MRVLSNIRQLATCRAVGGQGEIHAIPDAALVWQDDTILWMGPERELPDVHETAEREDAGGRLVVPGLVDCHTHLAFGGWRADEFERRLRGESYLDIARAGGGIAATVRATRAATEDELVQRARVVLQEMRALGVTTVECKSGYGLDAESERKLLQVYRRLRREQSSRLVATFLGAHVVPPEFRERREAYVDWLVREMIPAVAAERLATACDVFVEESAFSLAEARAILGAARAHGLARKVHADQLSDGGGAALAAEVGALSADHLEHVSDAGIAAMAAAGTVAVSLPLASLYLQQPPMPARRFIEAGVPVAVATDFNPGSAPSYHLPMAMTLACTLQRMTPAEVLKGATIYAARAIGMESAIGSIEPGKRADLAVIDAPDVNHWLYHLRPNACVMTVVDGVTRWIR
ncbi:MAG: imidazolonepropionase [Gemmatimonadales bacterium]|jgi:imidazolonepropionase|nr:imidazolonepropionase [Gemmatimonadales bacterium]